MPIAAVIQKPCRCGPGPIQRATSPTRNPMMMMPMMCSMVSLPVEHISIGWNQPIGICLKSRRLEQRVSCRMEPRGGSIRQEAAP
jgi:hypothetical protein